MNNLDFVTTALPAESLEDLQRKQQQAESAQQAQSGAANNVGSSFPPELGEAASDVHRLVNEVRAESPESTLASNTPNLDSSNVDDVTGWTLAKSQSDRSLNIAI